MTGDVAVVLSVNPAGGPDDELFLAIWGLIGYAILLLGSVLQVLGLNLNSIHAIPGGLWELFIGVWLIAKGFSTSSQLPSEPTISTTTSAATPPLVGSTSS